MGANAQTSVPAFTSGQILTAAQMTQVNTGIPVFASSTERDAAFGGAGEKTLAEGQMAYLEDTNATQYYDGSSWAAVAGGKILQVLSTTKLDAFTTSSTTLVDVTGLSVSVTPSSTSSKVLVLAQTSVGSPTATNFGLQLVRDSTAIFITTAGSANATAQFQNHFGTATDTWTFVYLDSPASSSATTYKMQVRCGSGSVKINEGSNTFYGATSSITVLEVSA